jgi:hypothetical protein
MLSCIFGIFLVTLLLTAGMAEAASLTGRSWKIIPSPNRSGSSFNDLFAVATISMNNVWAVGASDDKTLVEHWNGSKWSIVSSPNVGTANSFLLGVAAVSPTNIWAVGYSVISSEAELDQTLIEHWNGSNWSIVPSPNPPGSGNNTLHAVAVLSAGNIWAVGGTCCNSNGGPKTLVEHWNGTTWSIVPSPTVGSFGGALGAVAGVSASNIWAVGSSSSGTLIEHWNGRNWSVVSSPNPAGSTNNSLSGVTVVSAVNIWAVGTSDFATLILHWDGSTWSIVSSPNPPGGGGNALFAVSASSANNVWAVGRHRNESGTAEQPLIECFC